MITPQTETFLLRPEARKPSPAPEIVWESLPPGFPVPDEPMDNTDQFLLAEALRDALACAGYLSETRLFASSVAINVKVNGKTILKAPDWFYVPYVHPVTRNRRSYAPVAEGDRPAVVMEFLSDYDGREYDDSPRPPYGKWYFYEQIMEIPWYVIFDAEAGELEVWHLAGKCYQKQTPQSNGHYWIDALGLFLGLWDGPKEDVLRETLWLRWWDADDKLLLWQCERIQQETLAKHVALEKAERDKRQALEQAALEKQEALAQGEKQMAHKIARQMLQTGAEIGFIAQVTGLSEADVLALQKPA